MKKKNIVDYLREHNNEETFSVAIWKSKLNKFIYYHVDFVLYEDENEIELLVNDEPYDCYPIITKDKYYDIESEIQDALFDVYGIEIRFCDYCGCPMDRGYTDDDADFYNCEECFPKDMDERYGKGNWRSCGEENSMCGFYEYLDKDGWNPEPSYYTEWN